MPSIYHEQYIYSMSSEDIYIYISGSILILCIQNSIRIQSFYIEQCVYSMSSEDIYIYIYIQTFYLEQYMYSMFSEDIYIYILGSILILCIQNSIPVQSFYLEQCIYSIHMQYSFVVYLLNHICSVSTGFCKTAFKILYQIRQNVVHIYISIYSNEQDVLRLRGLFQLSQAGV